MAKTIVVQNQVSNQKLMSAIGNKTQNNDKQHSDKQGVKANETSIS